MNIEIKENRRLWEIDHKVTILTNGIKIKIDDVTEDFVFTEILEDGEYIIEDSLSLPYNPIQKIIKEDSNYKVFVFYDNPHEYISDWVPPFNREGSKVAVDIKSKNLKRISEIDVRLEEIDKESLRPTRAMLAGTASEKDTEVLDALEQEVLSLREERRSLTEGL